MVWRKEDVLKKLIEDKGERSLRTYASVVGASAMYINDVLNNRREPGPRILKHLGLEKEVTTTYKPTTKKGKKE